VTRETRRVAVLGAVFCPGCVDALLSHLSAGDALHGRALARELAEMDRFARLAALAEAFWPAELAGEGGRPARLANLLQRERPQLAAAFRALLLPSEACAQWSELPDPPECRALPEPRESSGPVSPVLARLASEWSWEERT
jgi:hypothetical protein